MTRAAFDNAFTTNVPGPGHHVLQAISRAGAFKANTIIHDQYFKKIAILPDLYGACRSLAVFTNIVDSFFKYQPAILLRSYIQGGEG